MFRSKTLVIFLLKAVGIYIFLSLPFSVYDQAYGSFYRQVAGAYFYKFRETGFVKFVEMKEPLYTHLDIGNNLLGRANGTCPTVVEDIDTRYLGYIPTILLISLVLASPVSWKRILSALALGLTLVTFLIIFKQWINLLRLCELNPWMQLTNFTGLGKMLLNFTYRFISASPSTVLYIVVAIWLLVTFRIGDFKLKSKTENTDKKNLSPAISESPAQIKKKNQHKKNFK